MPISVTIARIETFQVEAHAEREKKTLELAFHGQLTELANLDEVWAYISKLGSDVKEVTVDLRDVHRINSVVVLNWLSFIRRIQARLILKFSSVSESFIEQASAEVPVLGKPGTAVASVEVPLRCPKCLERTSQYFRPEQLLKAKKIQVPTVVCIGCQSKLELDHMEEEYFSFLK